MRGLIMRKWYSLLILVALLGSPTASLAIPLTYEVVGSFDSNGDPLSGQSFELFFTYNTNGDKENQPSEVTLRSPKALAFYALGSITVEDGYILVVFAENLSRTLRVEFHMIFDLPLSDSFTMHEPLFIHEQEHGDFWVFDGKGDFLGAAHQNQPVLEAVPEPGTFVLLASGLLWLGFWHWRRHARTQKRLLRRHILS